MSQITRTTLIGLSLLTLTACGPKKPEAQETPPPASVQVIQPFLGPQVAAISLAGVSAYRDEAKLAFKVGGVIEQIAVREGQAVQAGQRLASLNKKDVNAAKAQARAGFNKAKRDFERGKVLREQEVITEVQLNDLRTQLDLARAQLSQAQYAAETAEIIAPANGVVLRRLNQATEVVAAGQPVLIVGSQASGFVFKASLSDSQAVQTELGNLATVQFDAHPGVDWPGEIVELSQAADPATGTYGVQVQLNPQAHPDLKLLSGLTGKVRIQPEGFNAQRQYLPLDAIVEGDNEAAWIYVLQGDQRVRRTAVQVAFVTEQGVALVSELPSDARIVTSGAPYLSDGQVVTVTGAEQ